MLLTTWKLANVRSLMVHEIDAGCSGTFTSKSVAYIIDARVLVTYYSDGSRSTNANLASPNYCVGFGDGSSVGSFSWDCSSKRVLTSNSRLFKNQL